MRLAPLQQTPLNNAAITLRDAREGPHPSVTSWCARQTSSRPLVWLKCAHTFSYPTYPFKGPHPSMTS